MRTKQLTINRLGSLNISVTGVGYNVLYIRYTIAPLWAYTLKSSGYNVHGFTTAVTNTGVSTIMISLA
jgi:hypothetical protein